MGKYDRCAICDYAEATGSAVANVEPGENGRVRFHKGEPLCAVCFESIMVTADYHRSPEEIDEDLILLEE